ncbi:hypothetical protein ACFQVD_37075 [Streptosporangium amethystogenes subsp. fukuiense]|uniref:Uncharacterized protein n=1 Tax=Streptosporangium amethystogenes subsp. fukuiense TaxID=698418 RepID=A0ABW2TD47_9ACTN
MIPLLTVGQRRLDSCEPLRQVPDRGANLGEVIGGRWLHSAARTRETDTYALLSLIPALAKDLPGKPTNEELRAVLRDYALLPEGRRV